MRVAFYAPLKAPDHPNPSGDRTIARGLVAALEAAGCVVEPACRLRAFDGAGDAVRQKRLAELGARAARAWLQRRASRPAPDLWLTYHLYHKAPDWLGPGIASALGIPYVVVEASVRRRDAEGPWAAGHRAVTEALGRADLLLALNPEDPEAARRHLRPDVPIAMIPPFLATARFAAAAGERARHRAEAARRLGLPAEAPWLLAVGMMRPGAKVASYHLLAEALERCRDLPWTLLVIGDGPERPAVTRAMGALTDRVVFLGGLPPEAIAPWYAAADLAVWPAIDEAIGMALLEGQAAGLPAVAGDHGAIGSFVRDGVTGLTPPVGDVAAFAAAVRSLIGNPTRLAAMRVEAARLTLANHDLSAAASRLGSLLTTLTAARP